MGITTEPLGPVDPRVGRHPYFGPAGDDIRACDLPGCNRRASNGIHDSAPAGSRVLEAAKAVARLADDRSLFGSPTNYAGSRALALLDQALSQAGHPTRSPSLSERAMAEAARLKRDEPEVYAAIGAQHIAADVVRQELRERHRRAISQRVFGHPGAHIAPDEIDLAIAQDDLPPDMPATPDGTSAVLDDYQNRGQ